MSSSNMVADNNLQKDELKGLPMFDTTNVVNLSKLLKMWLMRKRRNHLGLEDRPERPPNNAIAIRGDFKLELSERLKQKDSCVSSIYESVQGIPEALEFVEQYIREKEFLPANDPIKEVLVKELIERLNARFRGEIQDELGDLNNTKTHFINQPDEKVCTGIDWLNGIIQKPSTDASKLAKLKEALEIPYLYHL